MLARRHRNNPPSLWFYGANDSYTDPELVQQFLEAYTQAGGQAWLVAFGEFGQDAHGMSASRDGVRIWLPEVEAFLKEIGLPSAVVTPIPESAILHGVTLPSPSQFANLNEVEAAPYLRESGQKGYAAFLKKNHPRAFAISSSCGWGWASSGWEAARRAMNSCQEKSQSSPCRTYAIDDEVVWNARPSEVAHLGR